MTAATASNPCRLNDRLLGRLPRDRDLLAERRELVVVVDEDLWGLSIAVDCDLCRVYQ